MAIELERRPPGRPPSPVPLMAVSYKLPLELVMQFKELCQEQGCTQAFALRDALTDWTTKKNAKAKKASLHNIRRENNG